MSSLEKWLQGLPGRGTYSDPEVSESTTIGLCPPLCDSEIGSLLGAGTDFSQEKRESRVEDIRGKVWVHVLFCMRWTEWAELACSVLRLSKCFTRRHLARALYVCLSLFIAITKYHILVTHKQHKFIYHNLEAESLRSGCKHGLVRASSKSKTSCILTWCKYM